MRLFASALAALTMVLQSVECFASFDCAKPFQSVASVPGLREQIFNIARRYPIQIAKEAGTFIFYPAVAPVRILDVVAETVLENRKAAVWIPFEYVKKDGIRIAGVAVTYAVFGGSPSEVATYFIFPHNLASDFQSQLDNSERTDGITIYVDGVPEQDTLAGFGEADFQRRFSQQQNAFYIHPRSASEMMGQIQAIAENTGKPIARLEILGHGSPGKIQIGSSSVSAANSSLFSLLKGKFAPKREVRFQSCSLGASFLDARLGEDFLKAIGSSALDQGGSVFASNHTVYVDQPFEPKYRKPAAERAFEELLSPLQFFITSARETGKVFGSGNEGSYRRIEIAPQNTR